MSLGDAWYTDPTLNQSSAYTAQYAQDLEASGSFDLANLLRQTGDVIGVLAQQATRLRQQQLDDTLIRQQIERARAGLPPISTYPSTGTIGTIGGAPVNWTMVGLAALGVGAVLMMKKRR